MTPAASKRRGSQSGSSKANNSGPGFPFVTWHNIFLKDSVFGSCFVTCSFKRALFHSRRIRERNCYLAVLSEHALYFPVPPPFRHSQRLPSVVDLKPSVFMQSAIRETPHRASVLSSLLFVHHIFGAPEPSIVQVALESLPGACPGQRRVRTTRLLQGMTVGWLMQ